MRQKQLAAFTVAVLSMAKLPLYSKEIVPKELSKGRK
jgi:hypothetical protein